MENQVVLVTGAKGGLGSFVTRTFLNSGAQVVGTARQIDAAAFDHANFTPIPADLQNSEEATRLVSTALEKFQKIDALIHVAGGFAGGTPIHETEDQTWVDMIQLNLGAAMRIIRAVLPGMRERKSGRIVAI